MEANQETTTEFDLVRRLEAAIVGSVADDSPDINCRALAILLIVHSIDEPHTVRGMSSRLNIPTPAVTRALDRLEEFGLARRIPDPSDRRSVLLRVTSAGKSYLQTFVQRAAIDA